MENKLKQRTHGTRNKATKTNIFEAKMAPKMDPGDQTVGKSSAQKGLLDASGAVKTTRNTDLQVVGGAACFPGRGSVAEIAGPGSPGRPNYQRKQLKQPIKTGSDTPLGRWPGEFLRRCLCGGPG